MDDIVGFYYRKEEILDIKFLFGKIILWCREKLEVKIFVECVVVIEYEKYRW